MAYPSSAKRRKSRGAALVEAVVVIPFFIIIFASMTYVAHLYGEKQRTLREARQYAWVHAMRNCEGSHPNVVTEGGADPFDGLPVDPSVLDPFLPSDSGTRVLTKRFQVAKAKVTGSVTASKLIGGYTNQLSTTTRVQCNEEPIDGNLPGVLEFMWNFYKEF